MKKFVLVFSAAAIFTGCFGDNNQTILQWMPDMADSPTVKPQEDYLDPPVGSVSMRSLIYPKTVEEAEKVLNMPPRIAQDVKSIAEGRVLFDTFCAVCHGKDAKGKSTLTADFPGRPDLTLDYYKGKKDGFFFYRITFGGAVMPAHGYATSPWERWQIVKYLRTLQNAH
jgi:S-disulfanyl-L-cysteine oxidoreductase SoxD